jgi:outer membrane lipoprotein-sorting protein
MDPGESMRRFAAAALLTSLVLAPAAGQQPLTAEAIARRVQDRDTGRDSRATMRMTLFDRRNRSRERVMTVLSLRGGASGAARDSGARAAQQARGDAAGPADVKGDRLLIRFTYPNDIRGTGFLVWEHPASDDERFLYLPSLGRVRRIAGSEAQESFVGSDFTYEDIGGREFDEYSYALEDDKASWTPPSGGPARPAWRLESRRRDKTARFPRVVSLILKDTPGQNAPAYVVVAAEIYNRRDEKQKVYTVRRLEQVEGIWTAMEAVMTNALEKSRTELTIEKVAYNVGLEDSAFTRRELERAGR